MTDFEAPSENQAISWQEVANGLYPNFANGYNNEQQALCDFYDTLASDIVRANIGTYVHIIGRTAEANGIVTFTDLDAGIEGLIQETAESVSGHAQQTDTITGTEERLRKMIEMKQDLLKAEQIKVAESEKTKERKALRQREDKDIIPRHVGTITANHVMLQVAGEKLTK